MEKILIIDDEEEIVFFMKRTFERLGFEALIAMKGSEGIKLFKANKPKYVILDVSLGDLNGIKVLEEIKKFDPNAQVLFITGSTDMNELKAKELGAIGCLEKPITIDALAGKMKFLKGNE